MKTGLYIITPLLILSFLLGSTDYPKSSLAENTLTSAVKKPQCCSAKTINDKACSVPVTENRRPCKSSCSESEKDCPRCIIHQIAPFTIPGSPALLHTEIFMGIPGELKQNPLNYKRQPPIPPPVDYC